MTQITSIADLLKRHAKVRPKQVAFSGPAGYSITYGDLAIRTERIAVRLLSKGVARGQRVATVLGNCIEAVESTFAITRAAGLVVPLDARSAQAELARIFERCLARIIITDVQRLERVCDAVIAGGESGKALTTIVAVNIPSDHPSLHVNLEGVTIERYEEWAGHTFNAASQHQTLLDDLQLDEPAYLHYTTGTTGQPKGVLSSQQAWMWTAVNSYVPSLGLTSCDKLFWPLPLFHAFGQSLCIIGTVAVGASTHLVGDEPLIDTLLQHLDSTIIGGAPAIFRELVTNKARKVLSQIHPKACVSAGSAPPTGLSTQVEKLFGVPLINHYGCTECGCIATRGPKDMYREDSCGTPIPGVEIQIRLITEDGQALTEVADEEEGEICVRTPSFMLGYTDDLNNGALLPSSKTEDGWYRTGDLGRQVRACSGTAEKVLTVTGRLKELIIRGGENIHPLEVESALRACPSVEDVVVVGLPHFMLGEVPVAIIVPKPEVDVDLTVLLAACRAVLPDYKVPSTFYTADAIPHTASGKPSRLKAKHLLSKKGHYQPLSAHLLGEEFVEPLVLVEIMSVCGIDAGSKQLDPDQPFMDLGLNSLKSVILADRLASLTGLDLPITLVFEHPTPAAVIQHIRQRLFGGPRQPDQEQPTAPEVQEGAGDLEPIAIVSMACKYPGGISSPEDLWRVVSDGSDVTSDFPTDRDWNVDALYNPDPNNTGTCTTRRGGFLHDMADFDPAFFGMSPREALATDPQQRLLLETTHSLIERAGIDPSSLRGTQTGVFVGLIYSDYASRFGHGSGKGHEAEAHLDIGASPSVAAGRISYTFDLKGPSMALDAACSSSLTAIHLAAQSLQTRESGLAIAGGVTLMSTPRQFIAFSRQRGLASDGRCRPYSADAAGTGWSEGVGLILLERLSDARRNGHRVLGLVRGSAVNNDGSSAGLTVPSGTAQQEVIRQALGRAALSPGDVDVLDGHGTSTSLGDPIELRAIHQSYGNRSGSAPLLLGSVKSNIGHTQAAAGIASVIKMIKGMQYGIAPASINVSEPSPHIDWTTGALELLTTARPWPKAPKLRPRRAAVSSFGISGTNTHVILEHVEVEQERTNAPSGKPENIIPWLLSGADEAALRARAHDMSQLCHTKSASDVAFSLIATRAAYSHRASIAASGDELYQALTDLAAGRPNGSISTGLARTSRSGRSRTQSRLIFLFSGQGSQRPGMGQRLCAQFPQFDSAFRKTCAELDPRLERPLSEVIDSSKRDPESLRLLNRADFAQAAVFAFEVAMFRLMESFGFCPDFVVGHSLGEVAAAHAAGILPLADAATLVTSRGTLMAALPDGGSMVSVSASADDVNEVLQDLNVEASTVVAAVNAQTSVVVSGPTKSVLAVKDIFTKRGRPATQLRVSHAFHSPMMAPMLDDFRRVLRTLSSPCASSCKIPLVSTVTGELISASDLTAEYWVRHVIAPVRFADAIDSLSATAGSTTFVEIGPSAPLAHYVPNTITASGSKKDEVDILLESFGQLWVHGVQPQGTTGELNWKTLFKGSGAHTIDLPTYPFQRRRYWLDSPTHAPTSASTSDVGHASHIKGSRPHAPRTDSAHEPEPEHEDARASGASHAINPWQEQLSTISPEQRQSTLRDLVQVQVAAALGYQDGESLPSLAFDTPFTDLGCDSVMGIVLRNRLTKKSGVRMPANLIFDQTTATGRAVVEYLLDRIELAEVPKA